MYVASQVLCWMFYVQCDDHNCEDGQWGDCGWVISNVVSKGPSWFVDGIFGVWTCKAHVLSWLTWLLSLLNFKAHTLLSKAMERTSNWEKNLGRQVIVPKKNQQKNSQGKLLWLSRRLQSTSCVVGPLWDAGTVYVWTRSTGWWWLKCRGGRNILKNRRVWPTGR